MSHHHRTPPFFSEVQGTNASRREFLKRSSLLTTVAATATPFALSLAAIGEAAAQTANDYKAIVCIFLNGGNDHANSLVPYDTKTWGDYNNLRANIAYSRDQLHATALTPASADALPNGVQYALAPELQPLLSVFNEGALAPILNVGTLVEPTTLTQYQHRTVKLPPRIGSHNDQASYWQSSIPEGATSGWGGRLGDMFASSNGSATFTSIGLSGNAVFLAGKSTSQYQITTSGAMAINAIKNKSLAGSAACADVLHRILTANSQHVMEDEYARICKRSIDSEGIVASALKDFGGSVNFGDVSANNLAAQLQMVAKLIAARSDLGAKRQVFMVSIGGFDNHADLKRDHPLLLAKVGSAMKLFYESTKALGIANNVTTFTASDFGRTLTSNSSGSDHGWGAAHFLMGGAVKGKRFYGTSPQFANNGPDDFGQGRLVPSTSVDQLAATLATWFGAKDYLKDILPNIVNYSESARNLGFLKA